MLYEFWQNFTHNLFKPLLLFFYFGFLIPILKVRFEFPYVIYQGLTMYLLLAIGWHGGVELAEIHPSKIDRGTVAGYYGSDSAGTFATCVAVLASIGIAFDAYMPVMLAVMEIPGYLVALYLVARLRTRGMDMAGNMPGESGYTAPDSRGTGPRAVAAPAFGQSLGTPHDRGAGLPQEISLEKRAHSERTLGADDVAPPTARAATLREVLLNPGLCLLIGAIVVGYVSGLQGQKVIHDDDTFFRLGVSGRTVLVLA